MKPIIVGIAGGTASGKTTVCEIIFERIGGLKECTLIPADSFYKEMTDEEFENVGKYNFDHPNAFDWDLILETFAKIVRREDIILPRYNYMTCKRDQPGIQIKCSDLILFEGIFALFDPQIRDLMDLKIFVNTDDDIRLLRRLKRDVLHRGRTAEGVIKSYNRFVKAAYDDYIKPTMKYSDIIIPRGAENDIAIQFISENLKNKLRERGVLLASPTVNEDKVPQLQFPIIDEVLLNYSKFKSQMRVFDYNENPESLVQKKLLESLLVRQIYGIDEDIQQVHYEFLSKTLLELLQHHNQDHKLQSDEWQFLNMSKDCWIFGTRHLVQELERIHTDKCTNLCIFFPELTSKNTSVDHIQELLETIRQLNGFHCIEKIHILSFYMGSHLPINLMDTKSFGDIFFYTLYLSNELGKYPCFIEDHLKEIMANHGDDLSLENKLEAFKMKGTLEAQLCYKTFYSQPLFQDKVQKEKID